MVTILSGSTTCLPCLGKIAELLSADLDSGIHWRDLLNFPTELAKGSIQLLPGHGNRFLRQHRAGNILGVSVDSQTEHCLVGFFCVFKKLHSPGGAAYKYRQNAGCHRV